jgi:hypothetical protein
MRRKYPEGSNSESDASAAEWGSKGEAKNGSADEKAA